MNYAGAFSQSEMGKYFEWIIISVNVPPGHQRDRQISENSISVCKTLLLSLTLANYQLTTIFLAKYQLTVNPQFAPRSSKCRVHAIKKSLKNLRYGTKTSTTATATTTNAKTQVDYLYVGMGKLCDEPNVVKLIEIGLWFNSAFFTQLYLKH